MSDLRSRIRAAFAKLRKNEGFFARMNWQCCSGCGWSMVPETHKGPVAFFHKQDAEDLDRDEESYCYIAFGDTADDSPKANAEVGKILVRYLEAEGCKIGWSGSPNERPRVSLP